MQASRFDAPSIHLKPRRLLTRRMGTGVSLALAVVLHVLGTLLQARAAQQEVPKPLTTRFVKRAPRLSKPLEMRRRPEPKRRALQRKMVSVTARRGRKQFAETVTPTQMLGQLTRPRASVLRSAVLQADRLEPLALAQSVAGDKDPKYRMDLSLDMLDIDAMDTGQYHAMVVQDPSDRRNIRGFLHIALVVPARTDYDPSIHIPHIHRLADLGMNAYTSIRTDIWPPLTFDSSEMFKVPWLFTIDLSQHFTFGDMTLTDNERANLGAYLMLGGFVHADAIPPLEVAGYIPAVRLRKTIVDALDTQGMEYPKDWTFERLPNAHPMYHCYFDFDGPPVGYGGGARDNMKVSFLEGVSVDGRLLAIISQMHYLHVWGNWGTGRGSGGDFDPTRNLQFGVNIIVFALTQEGSITHRVMDAVQ